MTGAIETYSNPTSLQPRDIGEAMTLAKLLATSNIIPYALRGKPADIFVVITYGMELELSTNQALRGINVIKGRPSLSTELRVAKTRERGHRVGVVCADCGQWAEAPAHLDGHSYRADWTRERCTVKARRKDSGETAVITWTIEDAVAAGLLTSGKGANEGKMIARSDKNEPMPWETYTKDMLYARAADRACKQIAPEVAYGLYTREEIEQMPDEPTRVHAEVGQPVTAADLAGAKPPPASAPPASMETPVEDAAGEPDPAGAVLFAGQAERIEDLWNELGYLGEENAANRIKVVSKLIGHAVPANGGLTAAEADVVIRALEDRVAKMAPANEQDGAA